MSFTFSDGMLILIEGNKNKKEWFYYDKHKVHPYYSYYYYNPYDHACNNYLQAIETTCKMDIKKIKYII